MSGRGKGELKAFVMRCIDRECGYVHSMQIRKNIPKKKGYSQTCPSCFQNLSFFDFHNLSWLNTTHFYSTICDDIKESDQLMVGIAWGNQ